MVLTMSNLLANLFIDASAVVPNILGAFLILLIGWILGKVVGRLVYVVSKSLKADEYFKAGKKVKMSEVFSLLVSWIIYLAFIAAAVDMLKITALTLFFTNVLEFLADLLGGIVILVLGYVVAGYVQKYVSEIKTVYSEVLSQIIFFFILIITVSMALKVVGIPTQLLDGIILLLVGGIALGLAIALGLGLRDTVERLAKKYIKG